MRPLNPYKEIRHKDPKVDIVAYACDSVADYLRNKDDRQEFPWGETYGLWARIEGTQKLTIVDPRVQKLADILSKEEIFLAHGSGLPVSGYEGILASLSDAYLRDSPEATVFLRNSQYEKLNCPAENSNLLLQNSLVAYLPFLSGTKVDGIYFVSNNDKGQWKWNPKPRVPTRSLERVRNSLLLREILK